MASDSSSSLRTLQRSQVAQQYESMISHLRSADMAALRLKGAGERAEFLSRAYPDGDRVPRAPPGLLPIRVIDCRASTVQDKVVLVDWMPTMPAYSAVSHTFGLPVYKAFDCHCAAISRCSRPRHAGEGTGGACLDASHAAAAADILRMTRLLRLSAGSDYIWHDGVCIAQHEEPELSTYMQHMGWVYASARDTAIFLHYVGAPMAPLRHSPPFAARWQERVWTFQECVLSQRRRFCVRLGDMDLLRSSAALRDFERNLATWYDDATSTVDVVSEETFWDMVVSFYEILMRLIVDADPCAVDAAIAKTASEVWFPCLTELMQTMIDTCFLFPAISRVLEICSSRHSKHDGDRINSILTLAGVSGFVAPKDAALLEDSAIEFFKRLGQSGLALAVFSGSIYAIGGGGSADRPAVRSLPSSGWRHSWVPLLSKPLRCTTAELELDLTQWLRFNVVGGCGGDDQDMLEVEGKMTCVSVQMKLCKEGERSNVCADLDLEVEKEEEGRRRLRMDLRYDVPMFRATEQGSISELRQGADLGLALLPSFGFARPIVNGRALEFGEEINAYLVLPSMALELRSPPAAPEPDEELLWSLPAVLLQGDVSCSAAAGTTKIGCFHVFLSLQSIIRSPPYDCYITVVDRLLIR